MAGASYLNQLRTQMCPPRIRGARMSANGVGLPALGTPSMVAPGGMICGCDAWIMHPRSASWGCVRARPSIKPVSRNSS